MEQKTVNFGEYNSKDDLGLAFISFTKSAPVPQIKTIEVPFRDGALDITEYFGEIRYNNRDLNFTFYIPWETEDHAEVYSNVLDKIHGKKMKIVLASDPDWYYLGRIEVGEESIQNGFWSFQVVASCYPYKLSDVEREITVNTTADNKEQMTFIGTRMSVIPEVEVDPVEFTIVYNGQTYHFGTGTFPTEDHPVFTLSAGDNHMDISGKGTLIFQTGINSQSVMIDNLIDDPQDVNIPFNPSDTIKPNIEVHLDESTRTVTPTLTVSLDEAYLQVTPIIRVDNADDEGLTIIFGGETYTFTNGTHSSPGFKFTSGSSNTLQVYGRGTLTIEYMWYYVTEEINTTSEAPTSIDCDYICQMRIDFMNQSHYYSNGSHTATFSLNEGSNILSVYGVGTLGIEYADVSETLNINQTTNQPRVIEAVYTRPGLEVEFNEQTYTYYSGIYVADFELNEGDNDLTLIGNGTIIFTYESVEETFEVEDEEEITLTYEKPTSIEPTIISTPDVTLELRNNSYSFSEGIHTNTGFIFTEGTNDVLITGQGNIKFIYKEGRL